MLLAACSDVWFTVSCLIQTVDLSWNALTGSIPDAWAVSGTYTSIDLSENKLE